MKTLIVCGTFNEEGGSTSYYGGTLYSIFKTNNKHTICINGGKLDVLIHAIKSGILRRMDAVVWLPKIDNVEDKLLPSIKRDYPHIILVQSKRSVEKEYTDLEIIKRLLESHAALGLKITNDGTHKFTVMDPLGNEWCGPSTIGVAAQVLSDRVKYLHSLSRANTEKIDERREFELPSDFLNTVRDLGLTFSEMMDAANPKRFLGNASTRCAHGFPSMRSHDTIFVSKRNVDKTIISNEQFVEVKINNFDPKIRFYGDEKPSVDTPVQALLYEYYTSINFMVHGHVYIKDAEMTPRNIPCGFLEESDEITEIFPDRDSTLIMINLKGHGCLIMAKNLEDLQNVQFEKRDCLEKC